MTTAMEIEQMLLSLAAMEPVRVGRDDMSDPVAYKSRTPGPQWSPSE